MELRPQRHHLVTIAGVTVFCAVVVVSAWTQDSLPGVARGLVVGGFGLILLAMPYGAWRILRLRYLVTPDAVTEVRGRHERTVRFASVTRVRAFRDRRRYASTAGRQTLWLTGPEATIRIPGGLLPTLRPILEGLVPAVADRPEVFPVEVEQSLLTMFLSEAPAVRA